MPQETYYKLNDEKKQRVYNAVMNEYTRVPLEEVSVKNIVIEASISRGSFYQYFEDKEDALRYLVKMVHQMGERQVFNETPHIGLDLYRLIKEIFYSEVEKMQSNSISLRAKLLKQTAHSPRGTAILFEELSTSILNDEQYIEYWKGSGINHLSESERSIVFDLLFTSLRGALLSIIEDVSNRQEAEKILNYKIEIIKQGVGKVMYEK